MSPPGRFGRLRNPRLDSCSQWFCDALPQSLALHQIGYEHIAALGGLRGKRKGLDESPNPYWSNQSFRNYADYALTNDFREGLQRLRELGQRQPVAIMCAEAVWWRCHRRIIADYLLADGEKVFHILSSESIRPAEMTPGAQSVSAGLVYPATP